MSKDIQGNPFRPEGQAGKVPMHPEDYRALLAWVRAKEQFRRDHEGDKDPFLHSPGL